MKRGIFCITGVLLFIGMVGVAGACTVQRTEIQKKNAFIDPDGGSWGHQSSSWAFNNVAERLSDATEAAENDDISPHGFWRNHYRHHPLGRFNRLDASTARWLVGWLIDEYNLSDIYGIPDKSSKEPDAHAPVPASLLLLASGLVGLVGYRRTANKSA